MKILTVKIDEDLLEELDDLTSVIQRKTGLRISRHSLMVKAIRIYVSDTKTEILDS